MKKFIFTNGKEILEDSFSKTRSWKNDCIMKGCFDKETGEPLDYYTVEATEKEVRELEEYRIEVDRQYREVCSYNRRIERGNKRLAEATNINEFLNSYNDI